MSRSDRFAPLRKYFPQLISALAIAWVMILRNPAALFRAEFWAEDGVNFFGEAVSQGWQSVGQPVTGYYHLIPRLIASFATLFPVLWAPYLYAFSCLGISALILSYFVKDTFAWILPDRWQRAVLCWFMAIGPGTAEVLWNLSNLHSLFALMFALCLLEAEGFLTWKRFFALLFLLFSAAESLIFLPLVFCLWQKNRDRKYLFLLLLPLPFALITLIRSITFAEETKLLGSHSVLDMIPVVIENWIERVLVAPVFGPKVGRWMTSPDWVYWPLALAVFPLFFAMNSPDERRKRWPLWLASFCATGTFAIIVLFRNSNGTSALRRYSGELDWPGKYAFLPGMFGLLLWGVFFFGLLAKSQVWKRRVALVGLFLLPVQNLRDWNSVSQRPDLRWPEKAAEIQAVLHLRDTGQLQNATQISDIGLQPNGYSTFALTVRPK